MKTGLIVVALLLVVATALPLLRLDHWWIRVFDFPRGKITIASSAVLAIYLYFWKPYHFFETVTLGLLVLAVGHQAVKIFPYTTLMPKQVQATEFRSEEANLKLLIANVLLENRESEAFLEIVRTLDPDVILTMETDDWWEAALGTLEVEYPHTLKHPLDTTYGMLVYSRLEMIDPQIRFIVQDGIPSMHMQVVLTSGDLVYLHFVHPDPPNPKYATETTQRDAELLIIAREVASRDVPTIIAGDFNDVPWSRTTTLFQNASGLLDPRIGRGTFNTFNARNPLLRWPLDLVYHSEHFKLVQMETGPDWGSDHFPFYIELSLEPGVKNDQQEVETNQEEEKRVDEKIEKGE
ncbi:MAG: endonuclease/exonuclease/phosphatase family protein [Saccharospirillum sp.]|nr:endonuclease/exonuclease/phosphatase family protein [Saccharospirillum sp.]